MEMIELTQELILNEYKDLISGRKYWAICLIMFPVFLGIGALGGNIFAGIFMSVAMLIYMIASTIRSNSAVRRLKSGDFVIYVDRLTYKNSHKPYSKQSTRFIIQSENLFKREFNTIPFNFDNVEAGVPFYAVYTGKKLIRLYGTHKYVLSPALYSKVPR